VTTAREHIEQRIAAFQEQRRRCLAVYFLPGMTLFLIAIAGILVFGNRWVVVPPFLLALLLFIVGGFRYRCPACSKTPTVGEDGIDFDPTACPFCGARLKNRGDV
jgi:DNA-directed RNA polymerase subunit RPC12/RpoP